MERELASYDDNDCSYDMPKDVLSEIFLYLPVKSLVRLTCVCKSWLRLIRDPQFAIKHYLFRANKQSKLMNNGDYMVDHSGYFKRPVSSGTTEKAWRCCMYSLTEKKTFRLIKKIEFGHGLAVSVSNFCHGILCVRVCASASRDAMFLFCNPAIGEVVPIPPSINRVSRGVPNFGLGFDPTSNDYKTVAIYPPEMLRVHDHWVVEIYSVRSGSWHNVKGIAPLEKFKLLVGVPSLNNDGRTLNWLGHLKNYESRLMSFDMVNEVIKEITLPEHQSWPKCHLLSSSHFEALVCISRRDENFNHIDIWALNGSAWSKHVSFRFSDPEMLVRPINVWMNDKELFVGVDKKKERKGVFHYDINTQELKQTGRLGTPIRADVYTESLVSIKGFMASSSLATSNDVNTNDGNYASQQQKDNNQSICCVREVCRRNYNVRWSYTFKLGSRCL